MTVCNENRVHCGLLKSYIDQSTKEQTGTSEEQYLQGLYHLNGCDNIGGDEIKNQVDKEKGRYHI